MAVGIGAALVALVVVVVVYVILAGEPDLGVGLVVIGSISGVIMLLAASMAGPLRHGASLRTLGLRPPATGGRVQLLLPIAALVASLVFTAAYTGVVSLAGWDALKPPDVPKEIALDGPAVLVTFALVVLWVPLTEEVFFRGFVFAGLAGSLGSVKAGLASALLFALLHGSLGVLIPIFVTGLALAWVYHRTGSIWSSFGAHSLQNLLALSVSLTSQARLSM